MLKGTSVLLRCYSAAAAQTLLGTLRRRSGFPIIKCKEALTKNENDLDAAEEWLQKEAQREGWARVAKLEERQAKQGLIGLVLDNNRAAMIEVNCETDFVARNERFQSLVSSITKSTLAHLSPKLLTLTNQASLDRLTTDSIINIPGNGVETEGMDRGHTDTVADRVAETVGHLREKILVSRGCTLSCSDGLLCSHVYNNRVTTEDENGVWMGTYGTILHMIAKDSSESLIARDNLAELKLFGERICQHIVGANPESVEDSSMEESQTLVDQKFLFDDSVTVGELLVKNGVCVTRFVRYALGEKDKPLWSKN